MKVNELKQLIENTLAKEVKKAILESTDEVYIIKNKEGEPIEMCATQEEADEKLDSYQKAGKEFIIEKEPKPSIDELDEMGENLENMETEKQSMGGMEEELVGGQKKLDKNHNGKIDKQDFKILKGQKASEANEDECIECDSNMKEGDDSEHSK